MTLRISSRTITCWLAFCVTVYCIGMPRTATAWNNRGHMLVAQLAWQDLDATARNAAFELLKKHPHYGEFLSAEKPDNIDADEWAFLRAAIWPDWVRSNHSDTYNKPKWHYINIPFTPEEDEVEPPALTSSDLTNHTTPSSWAQEGYRAAVDFAYLKGELEVANSDDHVPHNQIPEAPDHYAENAGKLAQVGVAKAGHRLAATVKELMQ